MTMFKITPFMILTGWFFLTLMAVLPARANDTAEIHTEDEAFKAVFENPGDLILNFRLVIIQLRNQNIKGAVATLERILTLSRNNSQAQSLLAGAQYMLGNLSEARPMAETLLLNPGATETQKTEASALLALIDTAEDTYDISGVVTFGGGVVDNPEGGSVGNRSITGFEYTKRANAHSFLTSSIALNITGKLVAQLPESLSLGVTASRRDMDGYSLGDITSFGVSGRYLKTFTDHQLAFLGSYTNTSIDDRTYLDTFSLQVSDSYILSSEWAFAASARISQNSFHNSFDPGLARKPSEKNGSVLSVSWQAVRSFSDYQVSLSVDASDADRRRSYHAKSGRGISANIRRQLFGGTASAGLRHEQAKYKGANPSFQNLQREDKTTTATASFAIGLKSALPMLDQSPRVHFSIRYGKTTSNIDEFSKYAGEAALLLVQPI